MTRKYTGGEVIASGGFGCIFKPGLKCADDTQPQTQISKLMTVKHATEEYNLITTFNKLLKKIPNYEKYFLINNFTLCKPDKLTKNVLRKFNTKCKALTKKNIKSNNINSSLNKLLSLNMPYGGIDIKNYLKSHITSLNIIKLNNNLIDLLVNGIIPMNKLFIFHCDIKDSNILVDTNANARLIDWGLSVNHINATGIPIKLYRRPLQFNVPFSSILFNKEFVNRYTIFIQENKNINYFLIREFVINYIFIWIDIRGPGHLKSINSMIKKFTVNELTSINKKTVKEHVIEYEFTYYYIVEYISQILLQFTKNGRFELMLYFNTLFLPTIDIWGFVMVYLSMFEKVYESLDKNEYQYLFMNKIKYIIIHFLYESPTKIINISELMHELKGLNDNIKKMIN
jgi:serine/threonine protein kinase